jgi:adenine phosphoribosyltransferase
VTAKGSARDTVAATARSVIRDVPDFPKPGILFRDITPVLADAALFVDVTAAMSAPFAAQRITHVVGVESRGFIIGAPIAQALGAGFVPVRKAGKLPAPTLREEFLLEYGSDVLEVHVDGVGTSDRVLIVDDVLATGGTASAACRLVERAGATVVACAFLLELSALDGRARLGDRQVSTLITY